MSDADSRMAELLAALTNPTRLDILISLTLEPATASKVAAELDVPIEKVRYHLKRLRRTELVKVRRKQERRGAIENVYIANSRELIFDSKEMADYLTPRHSRYHRELLRSIFTEAIEAFRAGAFQERDDFAIIRVPMELDVRGLEEISAILDGVLDQLLDLRNESLARLEKSGEQFRPATSAFLFFETPTE